MPRELVTTLDHELRTPLTTVLGSTELLLDGDLGPLTRQQIDAVSRIEYAAKRLNRLVEDLLLLAGNGTRPAPTYGERLVDLATLARDVERRWRAVCSGRGLSLRLRGQEGLVVIGDRDRFPRVLHGLVSNAVASTPDGGMVDIVVARSVRHAILAVTDTGSAGLDQDAGFGLAVARAIVATHGGDLRLQPGKTCGCRVVVRLPLHAA